jgi:hypothetical protein
MGQGRGQVHSVATGDSDSYRALPRPALCPDSALCLWTDDVRAPVVLCARLASGGKREMVTEELWSRQWQAGNASRAVNPCGPGFEPTTGGDAGWGTGDSASRGGG